MAPEEFSRAFEGPPMTRARPHGLKRTAPVVSDDVGTTGDVDVLARTLDDPEPRPSLHSRRAECEHAAWVLPRIGHSTPSTDARQRPAPAARPARG